METDPQRILAWYERSRRSLSGRGLWLLGGEPNTHPPAAFPGASLRVLIVRLSEYSEVATGITHSYLLQMVGEVEGVYADLAFLPPARDEALMLRDGIPLLIGTGSKQPATAFDLIAISNSVVQELVNLPALLAHSGIPLGRRERWEGGAPFLLLGGSNSYATSVLHGPVGPSEESAGLVDGVLVGDGEECFPAILRVLAATRGQPREEQVGRLRAEVPGFYDPGAYRQEFDGRGRLRAIVPTAGAPFPVRAHRARLDRLTSAFVRGPIFYEEKSAGAAHVLLTGGCPYFCSFCKESWEQKPYRERPVEAVVRDALHLKASLGLSEIALMTFNFNTYSGLFPLLEALDGLFDRVAIKSQRFDAIARLPSLLDRQLEAGKRTYTCAMEGISDRLRELLQKNLPETVLLKGFQELFRRNIRQMKVFVIVTGFEQEADLGEFAAFLGRLRALMEGQRGKPQLTFSLAVLFRPPFTPLQFSRRPGGGGAALQQIMDQVAALVRKGGFESRISAGPYDALVSEWLAYADRRATASLVRASLEKGFRYRGEIGRELWEFLRKGPGVEYGPEGYLESGGEAACHPWEDVDVGIPPAFLARNHRVLEEGGSLASCLGPPDGAGVCIGCGACTTAAERAGLATHGLQPPSRKAAPPSGELVRFRVEALIPRRWADCGPRFLEAALARLVLQAVPEWVPGFLRWERAMPREAGYGLFWADCLVRGGEVPKDLETRFPTNESGSPDLVLRSVRKAGGSPPGEGGLARLEFGTGVVGKEAGMRVDAFLQRYRLVHQKKWVGERLTWSLQSGHAKKSGLIAIVWPKEAAFLEIRYGRWPERHVFPALAGEGALAEVVEFDRLLPL